MDNFDSVSGCQKSAIEMSRMQTASGNTVCGVRLRSPDLHRANHLVAKWKKEREGVAEARAMRSIRRGG